MRKVLIHIVNFTLVIAVLMSSSGFLLNKMECLISGNTFVSFTPFDCCDDENSNDSIAEKCCDFDQLILKLDTDGVVNDIVKDDFELQLISSSNAGLQQAFISNIEATHYTDLPPPIPVSKRLSKLQTYLI